MASARKGALMRRQHSLFYTIAMTILMAGLVISKASASSLSLLAFMFIGPLLILFIMGGVPSRSRPDTICLPIRGTTWTNGSPDIRTVTRH